MAHDTDKDNKFKYFNLLFSDSKSKNRQYIHMHAIEIKKKKNPRYTLSVTGQQLKYM